MRYSAIDRLAGVVGLVLHGACEAACWVIAPPLCLILAVNAWVFDIGPCPY